MAFDSQKYIIRFGQEAKEHIRVLNNGLLALEKNPVDMETINTLFRAAHTIKGAAKMLKLTSITEVAHKMEDILDELRGQTIAFNKELSSLLFLGVDALSEMISVISVGGEITTDYKQLCDKLQAEPVHLQSEPASTRLSGVHLQTDTPVQKPPILMEKPIEIKSVIGQRQTSTDTVIRISSEKLDDLIKLIGEIISSHTRINERFTDLKKLEKSFLPQLKGNGDSALNHGIKELSSKFKDDLIIYDLLINDLRENALKMRMLPLSIVFEKFPRLVRDIASSSGKEVEFIVEGDDTELDKKIIEKIEDSFIHLLRNSVDHGIETGDERLKAGKSRAGTIRLSACYEGGSILIELSDDGAGIPIHKIKEKVLAKKLLSQDTIDTMSESDLINLIFTPGFSTSDIVTSISGRGVGMDVVKRSITEDLKGTIEIISIEGKGTTFYIRLPLTLSITRVLLISVSDSTYAIPSYYCQELLRVAPNEIIPVADKLAIRLREQFIPIEYLSLILKTKPSKSNNLLILIIKVGLERMGLIIDAIIDQEDMALLPLPSHMRKNRLVSGIIKSGNELINILHAPTILEATKTVKNVNNIVPKKTNAVIGVVAPLKILVVDDSINTREIERDILVSYGYNVDLASDGLEAIEMTRASNYDVIITDVEMPYMDGFTLTETIRKDNNYKYTPIIIVTSREKEEDKKRGISVGANAYIVKGTFEQTNLIETIINLVG